MKALLINFNNRSSGDANVTNVLIQMCERWQFETFLGPEIPKHRDPFYFRRFWASKNDSDGKTSVMSTCSSLPECQYGQSTLFCNFLSLSCKQHESISHYHHHHMSPRQVTISADFLKKRMKSMLFSHSWTFVLKNCDFTSDLAAFAIHASLVYGTNNKTNY